MTIVVPALICHELSHTLLSEKQLRRTGRCRIVGDCQSQVLQFTVGPPDAQRVRCIECPEHACLDIFPVLEEPQWG